MNLLINKSGIEYVTDKPNFLVNNETFLMISTNSRIAKLLLEELQTSSIIIGRLGKLIAENKYLYETYTDNIEVKSNIDKKELGFYSVI